MIQVARFSRWLFSIAAMWSITTPVLTAQDKLSATSTEIQSLLRQALQSEASGELVDRDRLLTAAFKLDSEFAPVRWFTGWMRDNQGQWQSVEQRVTQPDSATDLRLYESVRDRTGASADEQFELARWCARSGYPQQSRAHLFRVIELNPDHAAARNSLGYRRAGLDWIDPETIMRLENRAVRLFRGLTTHRQVLGSIAHDFRAHKAEARQQAKAELMKLEDPNAIAPVEYLLGSVNLDSATASLEWLSRFQEPEASLALVRFALMHPLAKVRDEAVLRVKERPYHDYVPELLAMLASPVVAMTIPVTNADGQFIGFRQAFGQERQGQYDLVVQDTAIRLSDSFPSGQLPGRNSATSTLPSAQTDILTLVEARSRAEEASTANATEATARNELVMAINARVARLMSQVTNEEFSGAPGELWSWWDRVNETEYQSMKLPLVRYNRNELVTRNYSAVRPLPLSGSNVSLSGECFARGTEVMTRKGLKAIESIRVGDMVLSRDVTSGELSWKPVLRATTRPPRPVVELATDSEKFRCTGGHLFWVSGKGWTKASQVRGGDILHAAAQPVVVMKKSDLPEEQTYNLAIDQTHTYFVTKQLILSHDVTDRTANYLTVPGLTQSE